MYRPREQHGQGLRVRPPGGSSLANAAEGGVQRCGNSAALAVSPQTRAVPFLDTRNYPHLESPQFKQVLQPSIMTTAAVLHFAHSCAPSGKCDFEKASVCLVRASNSARFSCTSLR